MASRSTNWVEMQLFGTSILTEASLRSLQGSAEGQKWSRGGACAGISRPQSSAVRAQHKNEKTTQEGKSPTVQCEFCTTAAGNLLRGKLKKGGKSPNNFS